MISGLICAIKQEKLHPELLVFEKALTEELRGLIAEQRLKLREFLSYEDEYEVKVSSKNFKYMIYNSEIEKVDYLLKTYLKTRLKKVTRPPPRSSSSPSTSSSTSTRPRRSSPSQRCASCGGTRSCATSTTATTPSSCW